MPDFYCSRYALQQQEMACGTVKPVRWFLLLEDPRPWGRKAFEESILPDAVRAHLRAWLDATPASRLLLIRQETRRTPQERLLFILDAEKRRRWLYRFSKDDDLLGISLPPEGDDAPSWGAADPLVLVCTHGRRDACCALFGWATYRALQAVGGRAVWQSSHLGGHRFAPNVLAFPQGVMYGRVPPEAAPAFWEALQANRIDAACYRGRITFPKPVQAAEYFARREMGIFAADDLPLLGWQPEGEARWLVRFGLSDGRQVLVRVDHQAPAVEVYPDCNAAATEKMVQYRLLDLSLTPS
ncbi:MAG: sucrase ferredoxin [Anaerolineales bacterium]